MKNLMKFVTVLFLVVLLLPACKDDDETVIELTCQEQIDTLRINQLQVLGSHNSYRLRTYEPILQFIYANLDQLPPGFSPDSWDYTHLTLEEQFNAYGIRSIELDVYNDPDGGLFNMRMGNGLIDESPESNEPALLEPGLKVMHFPDLDYNTNYLTFKDALTTVKDWSDSHPRHLPITILVEPKADSPNALLGDPFTTTIPFDNTSLETIDQEIKAIFGEQLSKVITPDDVRGNFATLNEAVLAQNWPRIADARGKLIFVMIPNGNELEDYLDGHGSLAGRAMFAFSQAGQPETAFLGFGDPVADELLIQSQVTSGYMVRARADANTVEAREGNYLPLEAALRSGAHIISTDYYKADGRPGWSGYVAQLPNGKLAKLNPNFNLEDDLPCDVVE
nr:hypothetical protein [uncultured bacterium]